MNRMFSRLGEVRSLICFFVFSAAVIGVAVGQPREVMASSPAGVRGASSGAFRWPGTYDLVGTGFPEGERVAVLAISARDTSYVVDIVGPPGALQSLRIVGDSAHIAWNLGGAVMMVDLRGAGDSLDGRWVMQEQEGLLYGTRRR